MFDWWVWVALLLVVLALYLRSLAGRLDRLHVRLEAAAAGLDAQLARRVAAATEIAHSGLVDPATGVLLVDAVNLVHVASEGTLRSRQDVESALSVALRATLDDDEVEVLGQSAGGRVLLQEVKTAADRVVLARQFHNEVVRATLRIRDREVVRGLRLAGTAPWPQPFAIDDAPPPALSETA